MLKNTDLLCRRRKQPGGNWDHAFLFLNTAVGYSVLRPETASLHATKSFTYSRPSLEHKRFFSVMYTVWMKGILFGYLYTFKCYQNFFFMYNSTFHFIIPFSFTWSSRIQIKSTWQSTLQGGIGTNIPRTHSFLASHFTELQSEWKIKMQIFNTNCCIWF